MMSSQINKVTLIFKCLMPVIFLFSPVKSEAMIVFDPSVFGKMVQEIEQLRQQYDVLKNQYDELKSQYSMMQNQWQTAKDQLASMKGNYGWGNLGTTGQGFVDNWKWTADTWQNQLQGLSGGSSARYQQLLSSYKQQNDSMNQNEFHQSFSNDMSKALSNEVQTNQAVGVTSQLAYEKVNDHVNELQTISQQIESSSKNTDIKSAMDLNTRAQVENGLLTAEVVRAQLGNNNLAANHEATEISQYSDAAKFNQDPKH